MSALRSSATLGRRLRLLLWLIVPLPALVLLLTSTYQYETELRTEGEQRLGASAKNSGLESYARLVDLAADLQLVAGPSSASPDLAGALSPWRDRFRQILRLGEDRLPEGIARDAHAEVLLQRLRRGTPGLLEIASDGARQLWLAVPLGPSEETLWAELRIDWLWRTAVLPAEGSVVWILLGDGGDSLLATSPHAPAGLVGEIRARGRQGMGTLAWTEPRGPQWRAAFVAIPLGFDFGHPGLVAAVAEIDRLGPKAALLRRTSWLVSLMALLAVALVSARRLRGDLEPIAHVLAQADRIAEGDLAARARIEGPADLERLASGFNHMGEMLQRNFLLLGAANAVASAALTGTPTVEGVASTFVEAVRPIAPEIGELVVVLFGADGPCRLVRAEATEGSEVTVCQDLALASFSDVLATDGWIPATEVTSRLPGVSRSVSAWRTIRRDRRVFGAVALLAGASAVSDEALLRALEGPCSQLDLAISRVQLFAERTHAEAAQRTAEARLKNVVASSPAVLYAIDISGGEVQTIDWMSENVRAMLGCAPEEASRIDWWVEHLHPQDRERIPAESREQMLSLGRCSSEFRVLHRDGEYRWLHNESLLLTDDAGRNVEVVGAISEITERKNLEAQVRHAQRMESLGRLAAGVAHDFNNLLTIISGRSDLLLASLAPDDPRREEVQQIQLAGERGAGLTRQLLAFSRQSVHEPQVLDLNAVVRENEKLVRRVIGENVRLSLLLEPAPLAIKADAGQIGQVLMNVVINARDAMPSGGDLILRTENVTVDAARAAERPGMRPGRFATLVVSDTGSGMTREVLARIFEPFFTTKAPGVGTGLGLATAYGIVQQHGGFVEVASEQGRGTTFRFLFPATDETTPARRLALSAQAAARGSGRILLVEDEEDVRSVIRKALTEAGYEVLAAARGADAIHLAHREERPFDLLITDVVMPGMSGSALVENLRRGRPDLRVLYISGYADDDAVREGVLQDEVSYLQKPFRMAALVDRVRELLASPRRPAD